MEFRSQKVSLALVTAMFWLAPALPAQSEFRYQARHDHLRKGGNGTLVIDDKGVSFTEDVKNKKKPPKHPHTWNWAYQDIQQLEVAPNTVRVLTYKDNKWKLGADREYRFDLTSGGNFKDAYGLLKDKLDQRFVAALADTEVKALWEVPVKHLQRVSGSQGILLFGEDRIVYRTDGKNDSRTWRLSDIENISSSGPFQLTLTTYERARSHYGNLKGFNFQLKAPLDENRYNEVWQRVNKAKGLAVLESYKGAQTAAASR